MTCFMCITQKQQIFLNNRGYYEHTIMHIIEPQILRYLLLKCYSCDLFIETFIKNSLTGAGYMLSATFLVECGSGEI